MIGIGERFRLRKNPEVRVRRLVERRTKKGVDFLSLSKAFVDALILNDRRGLGLSFEKVVEIVVQRAETQNTQKPIETVERIVRLQKTQDLLSNN